MPSATKIIDLIHRNRLRVFTTADIATLARLKPPAAAQALRRLAAEHLISRIKRGVWVNRLVDNVAPFEAVRHLCSPWPSYISLQSALAQHGVIDEIPRIIYAVSSNRPARYRTSVGSFQIHHLPRELIWGYVIRKEGRAAYPLAEAEKAFLDLVYLALMPRSPLGFPPPIRHKPWPLDIPKLKRYAARFKTPRLTDYLIRTLNIRA